MKNSLKKLRGLASTAIPKHGRHHHHLRQPLSKLDDVTQASQDMQDMRDCYDSLLSAAAATANSAYEFSESLREMGDCLLEKTALNDDEESGKVLLMLGKVQFIIQNLVDRYRSHIFQTITIPSESLLNELRTVEEMKKQCDEKRMIYEEMIPKSRGKGRSKSSKGDGFSVRELQAAQDDYDEDASMFVFRMKSLKGGQSRSLLTQASRHHAAQMSFFRKASKSLEAIDPQLDEVDITFPKAPTADVKENPKRKPVDSSLLRRNLDPSSKSAPLFIGKDSDPAERYVPIRQASSRKFSTYVLPTPDETKCQVSSRSDAQTPQGRVSVSGGTSSPWHSSPLEHKKVLGNENSSPVLSNMQSVLKDSNSNIRPSRSPPHLAEGLSSHIDRHGDTKKVRRQAFSGPLMGKSWSSRANTSASGPIASTGNALLFSGSLMRTPLPKPTSSPVLSSGVSPTFTSSPKISELHELPRPPAHIKTKGTSNISHSSPLLPKGQELSGTNKLTATNASTLPKPPQTFNRSYSIPSRGQREKESHAPKNLESPNFKMTEDISSPPVKPISLSNT
uniref:BAR domain-containing protein n=1 Tax=Daucus carota subsp. sativus TaxID=79200 RepID=A0A164TGY6_DAUCS